MMEKEDADVVHAAEIIRGELEALAPDEAGALGAALDEHIGRAKTAPASEIPVIVDDILDVLSTRESTRKRLEELAPFTDTDRGVAADTAWAPDWLTAGQAGDDKELQEIPCLKCGYVNKLAFRPPDDDRPVCQNAAVPSHLLEMA